MLHSFRINDEDILKAAKKLKCNNVCGPDNIPAFLVADCINCFIDPLCYIYNLILTTCNYPAVWKKSKISPIFKSGDNSDVRNFRPIALLSNFSKVLETILGDKICSHVINYITPEQHGFVKGKSTATNLYEFTQFVSSALDNRMQVDVIYTDLTKAFDRVNHCILLRKLEMYGICKNLLFVLRSVITGRKLFVEYGGFKSFDVDVKSGVAQGSTLGPLLFVIFFNDVARHIGCKTLIYADDLKIINVINCFNDCLQLQHSLDKLIEWCSDNALEINIDKCKQVSYTRK